MIFRQRDQDALTPERANVIVRQRPVPSHDENVRRAISQRRRETRLRSLDRCEFYPRMPVLEFGQRRSQIAGGYRGAKTDRKAASFASPIRICRCNKHIDLLQN